MSDFLKSLSARSFGLEDRLESVRPRLPSLFEMSRASWGMPQNQPVTATPEATPMQNESVTNSLKSHLRAAGHPAVHPGESEPVIPLVNLSEGFDAKSNAHSSPDPSPPPWQEASPAIRQGRFAWPEAASRTHQEPASSPIQPIGLDADLSVSGRLPEKKSVSNPGFKSSISAMAGPEQGHKATYPEVFPYKRPAQGVPQLQPVEVRSMTMQPGSLVADTSMLERMVMEKISLHAEKHPGIGDRSSKAPSKQKDILPLPDSLRFSIEWPSVKSATYGLENQSASTGDETAPTIQVTIGRIEIRATPPTSSVRKNTDKKPSTMSLEEYLNKRNGNGGVR